MHRPEPAFIKGGKRVAELDRDEMGQRRMGKRPLIKLSSPPDRSIELLYREGWFLMRNRWHVLPLRFRDSNPVSSSVPPSLFLSLFLFFFFFFFLSLSLSLSLCPWREMFNKNSWRASTDRKCRRWSACTRRWSSRSIGAEFHGSLRTKTRETRRRWLLKFHAWQGRAQSFNRLFRSRPVEPLSLSLSLSLSTRLRNNIHLGERRTSNNNCGWQITGSKNYASDANPRGIGNIWDSFCDLIF